MTRHESGIFEIKSWDEDTYAEIEGGGKLNRARVTVGLTGVIEGESNWEFLMCYREDGTSDYVGFEHVTGRIGERSGSFVMQVTGAYDGQEATGTSVVVPGSATGDLGGLRGRSSSTSTSEDYPKVDFTFDYDFE